LENGGLNMEPIKVPNLNIKTFTWHRPHGLRAWLAAAFYGFMTAIFCFILLVIVGALLFEVPAIGVALVVSGLVVAYLMLRVPEMPEAPEIPRDGVRGDDV
jgi:hypothetical protein